jgi:trehalose synthase
MSAVPDSQVVTEVTVEERPLERFAEVLDDEHFAQVRETAQRARELLDGRSLWCVNSTARGGGVAEMLAPLLGYARSAGVRARWAVISGEPEFFTVTKRIHHRLHGSAGDGGGLGGPEHEIFDRVTQRNAPALAELVQPGDVVLLHDPQTSGLVGPMKERGALVVWRVHIGADVVDDRVREVWEFLTPGVAAADAFVFSREGHIWETLDCARCHVIPPSIDAFSPKNQDLSDEVTLAILRTIGLLEGEPGAEPDFLRVDGDRDVVRRTADLVQDAPLGADDPMAAQVSRWDPLKDPVGIVEGFAACAQRLDRVHLVLAGPDVTSVSDDPEGAKVFQEVCERRDALPDGIRRRVHLASLPMEDAEENAAMVNAVQRYAMVVVQKSLAEGFGLTVAEALWKGRPVLASRVGGIQDQIENGRTGVLLDDPRDPSAFGAALADLMADDEHAAAMGRAGRESVREQFLEPRHLEQWVALLEGLARAG